MSWKNLITLGIAGGMIPTPTAVVVLLGATAIGRAWFGVLLVVSYGIGMAFTLVAAGLMLSWARNRFEMKARSERMLHFAAAIPIATASSSPRVDSGSSRKPLSPPPDVHGSGVPRTPSTGRPKCPRPVDGVPWNHACHDDDTCDSAREPTLALFTVAWPSQPTHRSGNLYPRRAWKGSWLWGPASSANRTQRPRGVMIPTRSPASRPAGFA